MMSTAGRARGCELAARPRERTQDAPLAAAAARVGDHELSALALGQALRSCFKLAPMASMLGPARYPASLPAGVFPEPVDPRREVTLCKGTQADTLVLERLRLTNRRRYMVTFLTKNVTICAAASLRGY